MSPVKIRRPAAHTPAGPRFGSARSPRRAVRTCFPAFASWTADCTSGYRPAGQRRPPRITGPRPARFGAGSGAWLLAAGGV